MLIDVNTLPPFFTSDYNLISFEIDSPVAGPKKITNYLDYRNVDYPAICEDILKTSWKELLVSVMHLL